MAKMTAVVVGGGVMGLAAGLALADRGTDVTVLERYTVGHEWASSHGLNRAIRHEYGPLDIYSQMVARSLILWDELARETDRRLYSETGVLTLGREDDGHTLPGYDVMRAMGLPVERLTPAECQKRFPQFVPDGYTAITWNPVGGMLFASECLAALADALRARGGTIREGARVARVEPSSTGGVVTLEDGTRITADRVIVAAGPWVHDVLPELWLPVQSTRQQVLYVSDLPPEQFAPERFPVFLAEMDCYGFPQAGPGWLKVGSHHFGETVDPNQPYETDAREVEYVRDFLRRVIPAVAEGVIAGVDKCMYDVTPDEDFILDFYPDSEGVIVASGFSGHGFKFGILIGRLLAALATGHTPEFPLDRFHLARFANG
jgi:monomeric sarcosine oxidase